MSTRKTGTQEINARPGDQLEAEKCKAEHWLSFQYWVSIAAGCYVGHHSSGTPKLSGTRSPHPAC